MAAVEPSGLFCNLLVPKGAFYPHTTSFTRRSLEELIPVSATVCWGVLPSLSCVEGASPGPAQDLGMQDAVGWLGEDHKKRLVIRDHNVAVLCGHTGALRWEDGGRKEDFCCLGEPQGWREGGRDRKCSISGDADNLL